jgi:hypothetical protein
VTVLLSTLPSSDAADSSETKNCIRLHEELRKAKGELERAARIAKFEVEWQKDTAMVKKVPGLGTPKIIREGVVNASLAAILNGLQNKINLYRGQLSALNCGSCAGACIQQRTECLTKNPAGTPGYSRCMDQLERCHEMCSSYE